MKHVDVLVLHVGWESVGTFKHLHLTKHLKDNMGLGDRTVATVSPCFANTAVALILVVRHQLISIFFCAFLCFFFIIE